MSSQYLIPELSPYAYVGLPGDVVETLAPHTESAKEALLLTTLAMFGNAVGFGPQMLVDGTYHRPKLFVCIVGASSRSRKGTSLNNVRRIFESADPTWVENALTSGLSTGEGLAKARQVKENEDESRPDPRMFVVEGEFARVLRAMSREGSTLSTVIRDWWDKDQVQVMTRKDPIRAEALLSIIAHVTVEELERELNFSDMMNGFANRFLFGLVQRSQKLPLGGNLSQDKIDKLARRLRKAIDKARNLDDVILSPKAEELWIGFYMQLQDDVRGAVGALTARTEAYLLRLAMTYALMDGTNVIERSHLKAAGAVWDYCAQSVVHIFDSPTGDSTADKLLEGIAAAGEDGLTLTEQSALFDRHVGKERLREARKILTDADLVIQIDAPTGGRSRTVNRLAKNAKKARRGLYVPGTPKGKGVLNLFIEVDQALNSPNSLNSQGRDGDGEDATAEGSTNGSEHRSRRSWSRNRRREE